MVKDYTEEEKKMIDAAHTKARAMGCEAYEATTAGELLKDWVEEEYDEMRRDFEEKGFFSPQEEEMYRWYSSMHKWLKSLPPETPLYRADALHEAASIPFCPVAFGDYRLEKIDELEACKAWIKFMDERK